MAELDDGFREEAPLEVARETKPSPLPSRVVTIYRGYRPVEQLRFGDIPARPVESVAREDVPRVDESR
jgi:hypothetical protein